MIALWIFLRLKGLQMNGSYRKFDKMKKATLSVLIALLASFGAIAQFSDKYSQEAWIRVDTLSEASLPIFIMRNDTTGLVILSIGQLDSLKYGTVLGASCIRENFYLSEKVLRTEAYKRSYEYLYHRSDSLFVKSKKESIYLREELIICRNEQQQMRVANDDLYRQNKNRRIENWVWRIAAAALIFHLSR